MMQFSKWFTKNNQCDCSKEYEFRRTALDTIKKELKEEIVQLVRNSIVNGMIGVKCMCGCRKKDDHLIELKERSGDEACFGRKKLPAESNEVPKTDSV